MVRLGVAVYTEDTASAHRIRAEYSLFVLLVGMPNTIGLVGLRGFLAQEKMIQ